MKHNRTIAIALAVVVLFAFGAFAKTTTAAKPHGMTVKGTVSAVDTKAKTLTITPSKGGAEALVWNDATKVQNGPLANGETAVARYMKHDGKNVATVITVQRPAAKKTAAKTETKTVTKTAAKH
ncbi:MAG TPA: hypothetical protein VM733_21020 [Thermoanaerobaculia bacterium]|nr:hypothetical protein [Thermoanaerobaculia bacterium]